MQNSKILSENNSNLKNKLNVQGQENDDNAILEKNNRYSDIVDVEEEESVDAEKIEIEKIDEEEEEKEIERNGDEKIEDKRDKNADVIEEKGLADLMKSRIQPRMKVFSSF